MVRKGKSRTRPEFDRVLSYLLQFPRREINSLEAAVAHDRRHTRRRTADQRARLEALESGLRRVTLAVRAMAELSIAKGHFTAEELKAHMAEVDVADGALDGGLAPELVEPGKRRLVDVEPPAEPKRAAEAKRYKARGKRR